MKYSVFSWKDGLYHYYDGPGEEPGNRPQPRIKVNSPNGNGVQLEALLTVLPATAQYIGKGQLPQGRIAVPLGDVAPLNMFAGTGKDNPFYHSPWLTLAAWAGGMFISWKAVQWAGNYLGDKIYD